MGVNCYAKSYAGGVNTVGKFALKREVSQFEISKAITFSKFFSRIKLKASARLVLRCLIDHWNPDKEYCFPRQNTIADETGCSRETVIAAIDELRAKGLIFTNGEKGEGLKYYIAPKFFELLEIQQPCGKIQHGTCEKISQHEQIKYKQINKTTSKKSFYFDQGIAYKSPELTRQELETSQNVEKACPLDYNKNEALIWLSNLPDILKNSYFAREVRKKWGINEADFYQNT